MYRFMSRVITLSARGLVGVADEAFFLGEVLVRFGVGLVSSDVAGKGGEPSSEGIGDDGASRLTTMMNNLLSRSQRLNDGSRCNLGTSGKRHLVSTADQYLYIPRTRRSGIGIHMLLYPALTPLSIPSLWSLDFQRGFTIGRSPHKGSFFRARHNLTHVFVFKG
jgi:hypothetical protein